jgi:hypothetical protein
MLKMFGLEHEVEKLLGGRVNSLSNVLTLKVDMHDAFDRFAMWLEEVPGQVSYCASNFSSRMTRQFNPRKIPILWKWPKTSAMYCGRLIPVLPLVSLSKLTQTVQRIAGRTAWRYPNCLVGI